MWAYTHKLSVYGAGLVSSVLVCELSGLHGCCRDVASEVSVVGTVLDVEASAGLTEVAIGGRLFLNQEVIAEIPAFFEGEPIFPPAEDGTFQISFGEIGAVCPELFFPEIDPPLVPFPDLIEIVVVHNDCQQSFMIEVNTDTIVDINDPMRRLELRDPIFVEPCN